MGLNQAREGPCAALLQVGETLVLLTALSSPSAGELHPLPLDIRVSGAAKMSTVMLRLACGGGDLLLWLL